MRFPVSPDILAVNPPPIAEVASWAATRQHPELPLIDLCQAVPGYPPAPELTDHLKTVLDDPQTARYSPDEGLPEVRESVCAWYRRVYGARITPDELCLTIGASQAFWLAVVTLCRAGDELLLQAPCYFDHPMALQALGIGCRFAPFDEGNGGIPSPAAMEPLIGARTRALLVVTPSNPTGAVTPPAVIDELFELARRRGIALILDETYNSFITGSEPPHRLFGTQTWGDHFIHLASFGKSLALTGFRAGLLAASPDFIRQALKIQDTMAVCQPRITQLAVRFGLDRLAPWMEAKREMMRRRHDCFRREFLRPGNRFGLAASGAFFAWVRHPWQEMSGRQAARRMVDDAGILCLPGDAFGPGFGGYLRLAFGNIDEETIPEAVRRFRECGG